MFSDASFAENFYGLKRVLTNNKEFTDSSRNISLVFLVLLPYVKRKLEEKLNVYKIESAEGCLKKDFEGRLKKLLLFSHSIFEMSWTLLTLANYLKYMSNSSESQFPILQIINMKLVRDEQQDIPGFWTALFKGQLRYS